MNPSFGVVDDTCRAACRAMNLQSKQLMILNASYSKRPFDKSGDVVMKALTTTMTSIQETQRALKEAAQSMKMELETEDVHVPNNVLVTAKEYVFLNVIFEEYTDTITSREFSLFSKQHDICKQCRGNGEPSRTN